MPISEEAIHINTVWTELALILGRLSNQMCMELARRPITQSTTARYRWKGLYILRQRVSKRENKELTF